MPTTFKAEGVCLGPPQLKDLKALTTEWDKQRTRVMLDVDEHGFLNCTQCPFRALSISYRPAHPLWHLLAVCYAPAPSDTLLAKVLVVGQK